MNKRIYLIIVVIVAAVVLVSILLYPMLANQGPAIISLIADLGWTHPSGSLQVTCNATDPDGDKLSYEWSASGGSFTGTGAVVSWIAPEEYGYYYITVVVTDSHGENATGSIPLNVPFCASCGS